MIGNKFLSVAGSASTGITYVGGYTKPLGSAQSVTFAGNLTGGISSSPQAGDMVLVYIGQGGSGSTIYSDSGYTIVSATTKLFVGYKFMGATPDTSIYVNVNNSTDRLRYPSAIVIHVFRNVNPELPFDTNFVSVTTSDTTVDPGAITPVTEGSYVVAGGFLARTANSDSSTFVSTDLTDFRSVSDARCSTTTCDSMCLGVGYYEWTSGTFNPSQFTFSPSNSYGSATSACMTLVLRPEEATVPPGIFYKGGFAEGRPGATAAVTSNFGPYLLGGLGPLSLGDLVVVYISTMSGDATGISSVTNNSGSAYTQVTYLTANDSFDANLYVGYKFVDSLTNDQTIIINKTGNLSSGPGIAYQVFSGVDTASPLVGSVVTATGTNSAYCDPPAITPNVTGAVIVAGGGSAAAAGLSDFTSSNLDFFKTAQGYASNVSVVGSGIKYWTSGSFDPAVFGVTGSSTSMSWAAATLALNPD